MNTEDVCSQLQTLFFGDLPTMQNTIVTLCHSNTHSVDIISHVIGVMITCPLQIQLVVNGIHLFKDRDLLFPYQHMSVEQREFLLEIMSYENQWNIYDQCIQFKKSCKTVLDTVLVLQALCTVVQKSSKYPDPTHRLAIMNIILQRVHHQVSIAKPVQQSLNKFLFMQNQTDTVLKQDAV
jgi:hypothetical protein